MKSTALIISTALLVSLTSASTAQIYKWVDDNGVLHYTERPAPAGKEAESIEEKIRFAAALPSKNRSPYAPATSSQQSEKTSSLKTEIKDEIAKNEKANQEYKEKLKEYCNVQNKNLQTLQSDSPIAWEENGKTELLTNQQRKDKIAEIQSSVAKNCSDSGEKVTSKD